MKLILLLTVKSCTYFVWNSQGADHYSDRNEILKFANTPVGKTNLKCTIRTAKS